MTATLKPLCVSALRSELARGAFHEPRTCRERERAVGFAEPLEAGVAKGGARIVVERGAVDARGREPGGEREPVVVEIRVVRFDHERFRLDVTEAGAVPEGGELAGRAVRHAGLVGRLRIELERRLPEHTEHRHLAGVVPDATRHRPPRDAPHLGDALLGIGHEVQHELREDDVEGAVGERELLGGGEAHVGVGRHRARELHERGRRVDPADVRGAETVRELCEQGARPATDVERTVSPRDSGRIGVQRREPRPVATDMAAVGVDTDLERHQEIVPIRCAECNRRNEATSRMR
jgi:hypothetical protein